MAGFAVLRFIGNPPIEKRRSANNNWTEGQMETGQIDKRDRSNLYREDAENIFVVETDPTDIDDLSHVEDRLTDAVDHLNQTGERRAYVVIKVCR